MPALPTAASGSGSWPTPQARDEHSYAKCKRGANSPGGTSLVVAAVERRTWTTPCVTDAVGAGNRNLAGSKAHAGESLTDQVLGGQRPRKTWPTPTKQDAANNAGPSQWGRNSDPLNVAVCRGGPSTQPMTLNPAWTEWLMGWPIGWTDCVPLETARFQQWLRSHGAFWHARRINDP